MKNKITKTMKVQPLPKNKITTVRKTMPLPATPKKKGKK